MDVRGRGLAADGGAEGEEGDFLLLEVAHQPAALDAFGVDGDIDAAECKRRYGHINAFEQMLVETGTTIVKCFLHISKDEQRKRLQERIDDPEKQWKFRAGDLDDRALWDDFQTAYEDAIHRTSTEHAPWHVVPADRNWVRNLAVAKLLLHALESMRSKLPRADPSVIGRVVE